MTLHAMFESWAIDDGNYPELSVGLAVNLAFLIAPGAIAIGGSGDEWQHIAGATYRFSGEVIARYDEPDAIVVVDAGAMRFACEGPAIGESRVGERITAQGDLLVDYYIWTENVAARPGAVNLFYDLVIRGMKRIDEAEQDGPILRVRRTTDVASTRERTSSALFLLELDPSPDRVARTFI